MGSEMCIRDRSPGKADQLGAASLRRDRGVYEPCHRRDGADLRGGVVVHLPPEEDHGRTNAARIVAESARVVSSG